MPFTLTKCLKQGTCQPILNATIDGNNDVQIATGMLRDTYFFADMDATLQVYATEEAYAELGVVLNDLVRVLASLTICMLPGTAPCPPQVETNFSLCTNLRRLELIETDVPIPIQLFRGVPTTINDFNYTKLHTTGAQLDGISFLAAWQRLAHPRFLCFKNFSRDQVMNFINTHGIVSPTLLIDTPETDIDVTSFIRLMITYFDSPVLFGQVNWARYARNNPDPARAWCLSMGQQIVQPPEPNTYLDMGVGPRTLEHILTDYLADFDLTREARLAALTQMLPR